MIIDLEQLRARALEVGDGYLEDCLASGQVVGGSLKLSLEDYERIREKYSGLGDKVAAIAKPTAAAIDAILGTHLASCKGCTKRQRILNILTTHNNA